MHRCVPPIVLLAIALVVSAACSSEAESPTEVELDPRLEVPEVIEMSVPAGAEAEQPFDVGNSGDVEMTVRFAADGDRIDVDTDELSLDAGEFEEVTAIGRCPGEEGDRYDTYVEVSTDRMEQSGAIPVEITCTAAAGTLSVNVSGLPDGAAADVFVDGADFDRQITSPGTTVLSAVPEGDYAVEVGDIEYGPGIYVGDDTSATVETGRIAEVDVDYSPVPGSLHVDADGLPDHLELQAAVDGPDVSEQFTGPAQFDDVAPGTYEVEFQTLTDDDLYYDAEPMEAEYVVESEATAEAHATYSIRPGELELRAEIPAELSLEIHVERNGETAVVYEVDGPSSETFELEPDDYTVTSPEEHYEDQWGNPFVVEGLMEEITVESGGEHTHSVDSQLPTRVTTEVDDEEIYGSLREVVGRVNSGSEVTFAEDLQEIALETTVLIDRPLQVVGTDAEVSLTQAVDSSERLLEVGVTTHDEPLEVLFQDIAFEGASATDGAAANITSPGCDVLFFGVEFIDNTSDNHGGAVFVDDLGDWSVRFQETRFEDNSADENGGALFLGDDEVIRIEESHFEHNVAGENGGAVFVDGDLETKRTVYSDNHAARGGALAMDGEASIEEAHFVDNTANVGGAIAALDGNGPMAYRVRSSLLENNTATYRGGAVAINEVWIQFQNTTLSENHASERGGAVYADNDGSASLVYSTVIANTTDGYAPGVDRTEEASTLGLRASYLADNDAPQKGDVYASGDSHVASDGYNFIGHIDGSTDEHLSVEDSDIVGGDADYEALSDNGGFTETYAIPKGADGFRDLPAEACLEFWMLFPLHRDQRGQPRPSGARCTRGAWEADSHHENFDAADPGSTPTDGSFDGVDGRTWHYHQARSPGEYGLDFRPEAIRLEEHGSYLRTTDVEGFDGDIESMTIVFRKAGEVAASRQLRVFVDDILVEESEVIGTEEGPDYFEYIMVIDEFGSPGDDFELKVENYSPDVDGAISIGELTWR